LIPLEAAEVIALDAAATLLFTATYGFATDDFAAGGGVVARFPNVRFSAAGDEGVLDAAVCLGDDEEDGVEEPLLPAAAAPVGVLGLVPAADA
jgi:hypothetical protein